MLPGRYTTHTHENLVRLCGWMPFERAVETLAGILGVRISPSSAIRMTEKAGAAYVALQTEAVAELERQAPKAPAGAEQMVFSGDGAMVPVLHGEWKEVRTLVIGEVRTSPAGETHSEALSYFSRLASAEEFTRLTLVETHRRGLENSQQVGAVVDGAEWLQGLIDYHVPQAVRILDFAHAAQRLSAIALSLPTSAEPAPSARIEQWRRQLKEEGAHGILQELHSLHAQYSDNQVLAEHLAYLEKRTDQMCYPQFIKQGWPIGSGIVESANKLVVEARLKGAGMHWQPAHVNPILALRNIICSGRWDEAWSQIEHRLRTDAYQHRCQSSQRRFNARRDKARAAKLAKAHAAHPPSPLPVATPPDSSPTDLPSISPSTHSHPTKRPAPDHPWRHSPIGRARYASSPYAKN